MATARDDLGELQPGYLRRPPEARGQGTSAEDLARLARQAGTIGLGFAPGAGMADYFGQFPTPEGDLYPSAMENVRSGDYGTAALQLLGAGGDMMYAVPLLGATLGSAMKGPRTAQRMLRETTPRTTDTRDVFNTVQPGDTVSGLRVREEVPNMDSIAASLDQYTVLPGIKEVPQSAFDPEYISSLRAAGLDKRTTALSKEIDSTKEINPLIIGMDNEGAYVIEGGHRFDALMFNDARSVPAIVVVDEANPPSLETLLRMQAPKP